jgi:hypothetical protein
MKYYAGLDIGKLHATVSKEAFRKHKFKYVLVSFYYLSKASPERIQEALDLYSGPEPGQEILLDSGAFSMMMAAKKGKLKYEFNLDAYVEAYGQFIRKYRKYFTHFFELDIQSVVGEKEYERLRKKLIDIVGEEPTLVWHIFDPIQKFADYCEKVGPGGFFAIGGVAGSGLTNCRDVARLMRELVWYARARDVHIHGLGITSKLARYIDFDSVDSFTYIKPVTSVPEFIHAYGYHRGHMISCAVAKLNQLIWDTF